MYLSPSLSLYIYICVCVCVCVCVFMCMCACACVQVRERERENYERYTKDQNFMGVSNIPFFKPKIFKRFKEFFPERVESGMSD